MGAVDVVIESLYGFCIGLWVGYLLVMAVSKVVACSRRWRSRLDADRLLASVPDVPLPDGGGASCVICIAECQRGEGCFVVPGCAHVFHRACMAPWLRQGKRTCPTCRAAVCVPAEDDDMVV